MKNPSCIRLSRAAAAGRAILLGMLLSIGAAQERARAQADGQPGSYRVGQTVNAHQLIVCRDRPDAEDILDSFKTSDEEAAEEFADLEDLKDCRRTDGEKVRIVELPAKSEVRKSDGEKVAVVKIEAGGSALYAVLFGDYRFEPAPEPRKKSLAETLPGRYSVSGVNPNGSSYSGEVTIRVDGGTYYLNWRVGRDTFRGSGRLSGRTLTINWGQTYPVTYQVQGDGVLRGRWANGRGTEDLEKIE